MKSQIDFEDFEKLDLRVGEVREVGEVEGSNKLLKLTVDFGEFTRIIPALRNGILRIQLRKENLFL